MTADGQRFPIADFDALPAGPELDALVDLQVFGRKPRPEYSGAGDEISREKLTAAKLGRAVRDSDGSAVPPYSTDDATAFAVVRRLMHERWLFQCRFDGAGYGWSALFEHVYDAADAKIGRGYSLPLAICRAALRATLG